MPSPNKKIALVTGANKGIGRAIAAQLAKTGMTVLLGARNAAAGEEAAAVRGDAFPPFALPPSAWPERLIGQRVPLWRL
jgi:NAD(P)-dependent dehydrogenase (short-subunit alcohol dehydrogenase family)